MNSSVTFSYLILSAQGGAEGGELFLAKPPTGSTLANGVSIDVNANSLRIFENGGSYRGVSVDLTGAGSQSNLWHSGNFNPANYAPLNTPTFTTSASVNVVGGGKVNLVGGSATNDGYVEFRNKDGVRSGYIGWSNGGNVNVVAENNNKFNFNINPAVNGSGMWHAGNFDPNTKLNATSPFITGDTAIRAVANTAWGGVGYYTADTNANDWYIGPLGFNAGRSFGVTRGGNTIAQFGTDNSFLFVGTLTPANISMPSGTASFGSQTRQMINLWSTGYGIGVQGNTLYLRTGSEFAVHAGGVHSDTQGSAGTGGTNLLRVAPTYFQFLGQTVWYAGNFDPNTKANVSGQIFSGDITTHRGNNTGVIFLGSARNRYLFFDGTNYVMPDSDLYVNGSLVARNGTNPRFSGVVLGTGSGSIYSDPSTHNVVLRSGNNTAEIPYRYLAIQHDIVRTYNSAFFSDGDIRTNGRVIVGEGQTASYIEMRDTDEGHRYIHNNGSTIGFLGSDANWKMRVYDDGNIWSPAFGFITTYVNGRVAKTGDTLTGDLTISKANPGYSFFYSGVYASKMWVGNDGIFRYSNTDGDGDQFRIAPGGALWCKQLGDINTRIEDRAFAWAADRATYRVAKTGDTMTGELIINKGDGQLRLADPGNNGQWRINAFGDGRIYFQDFFQGSFQGNKFYITRNGEMWTSQLGDVATYIVNVVNNKSIRLAYAGDLNHTWNAGGGYEEPYGGGVMTSRQTSGSPYNVLGFRWRYLQMSDAYGNWYTCGYV